MLAVLGILFVAVTITYIEYPILSARKSRKNLFVFSLFLFVGIGLNVINSLHIRIPILLDWLLIVYKPISRLVFG